MTTLDRPIPCILLAVLAGCTYVFGMSSTSQVASEGQLVPEAVVENYGWPAGVLELVNDPLRSNGWNPWFSEWPSDVNHYEFKLGGHDDLEQVIKKLAAIRCDVVRIHLDPAEEPGALSFTTVLPKGNGVAAVFAIGSQKIIDQWYLRLPEAEPGVRTFGVHRYNECPKAHPPTLTLFLGNEAIDFAKLEIPAGVEISAAASRSSHKENNDDPMVKAIDKFITAHLEKQKTSRLRNTARNSPEKTAGFVLCVAPRGRFKPETESELLSELDAHLPFTIPRKRCFSKQKSNGLVGWVVVSDGEQKDTAKRELGRSTTLKLLQVESMTPEFGALLKQKDN
jgi:hypothetical protein